MTADDASKLEMATEFQLPYWHTKNEYSFIRVCRGWRKYMDKWSVEEQGGFWNGEFWDPNLRGYDAYRYERDEALRIAQELVLVLNKHTIDTMERRFPGEFRGGPYDMAAQGEK